MKEDQVRKLIGIFLDSGVEELEYQESFWSGIRLRLSRHRRTEGATTVSLQAPIAQTSTLPTPAVATDPGTAAPAPSASADDGLHAVTSPMVGTFYRSPSPESEVFANVGDRIRAGQTICIIEAMKIMNEIESDIDGEVVEICIDNSSPVEYGQPLFRLRPS